jgi:hypothetical protein
MEQLSFFNLPDFEPSMHRRRTRTFGKADINITCRSERLDKRNRLVIARFYYWADVKRRRLDDVHKILADNEFFLDERTIVGILVDYNSDYNKLLDTRPKASKLRALYPGWDWS